MKKKREEAKKQSHDANPFNAQIFWQTHNHVYQENYAQLNSLRQAQRKHNERGGKRKMQCGT